MKSSTCNKTKNKKNHKPNLQFTNRGVIMLLLMVQADDQWEKGG